MFRLCFVRICGWFVVMGFHSPTAQCIDQPTICPRVPSLSTTHGSLEMSFQRFGVSVFWPPAVTELHTDTVMGCSLSDSELNDVSEHLSERGQDGLLEGQDITGHVQYRNTPK